MPSRLTLAAGVLGVASLAFVGVGGYAAFTSNANLDTSATAGTFILNASVGNTGTGCVTQSNCFSYYAQNYASNKGSLSNLKNGSTISTDGLDASLTWTAPNMAPGDEYWADIYLQDVGTLQGKVSEVTYTPPKGTPSALLQNMTVTVQEKFRKTWYTLPQSKNDFGGSGQGNLPANGSYTFGTAVTGGNVPFLQPLNDNYTDEQSAEFRVIYTLLGSAPNNVEGQTVSPTLNFVGTSLP